MNIRMLVRTFVAIAVVGAPICFAADWPAYRGDSARTARTSEQLSFPLSLVWKYVPGQKHQPAWTDTYLAYHCGMSFDYSPQVAIVENTIYFGSSTDNTLWALDGESGKTKWGFTTGGPIRFAPAIDGGRAYVVSDDGYAYCLDAASGELIWKFRGALNDRKMIGNDRMMSRWPIRSGIAVDDGVAYFAAGMFTTEGVFVFAVDVETGKEIWCNGANVDYLDGPHGSAAHTGNMPQGYLALSNDIVIFNNGMAGCWKYDRRTGRGLGRTSVGGELPLGRRGNNAELVVNDDGTFFHGGSVDRKGKNVKAHPDIRQNWVLTGDTLFKCEGDKVTATSGGLNGTSVVWEHKFEGKVEGIAVANEMLIVSANDGMIYCFKHGAKGNVGRASRLPPDNSQAGSLRHLAANYLKELTKRNISKGYALVLGDKDACMAEALAANTQLQVICALSDETIVAAERKRLVETTNIYGTRAMVDHLPSASKLPYPQFFANAIIVVDKPADLSDAELLRVQRPYGGLLFRDGKIVERSALAGALDWNSEVTADQRVKWPLEMLWFGEPGPTLQVGKGSGAPIPANGRVFYTCLKTIVAKDAYNGTELWRWSPTEPTNEKSPQITVDDKYVYVAGGPTLDAQTGRQVTSVAKSGVKPKPRLSSEDWKLATTTRAHPLTGGEIPRGWMRTHGCGMGNVSACMDFFRSGTLAFYDYEDASGIRNFAGVRPACHTSMTPALGLLLVQEGQGHACDCRYSYLTSFTMAPALQQRQEDWAAFSDPAAMFTSGVIRQAAINFGAPGDRRASDRQLWLTSERPWGGPHSGSTVAIFLPLVREFYSHVNATGGDDEAWRWFNRNGGIQPGVYRRNADRLKIDGTDEPWIYVSGQVGLKRLSLPLDYHDPQRQILSTACADAPKIDGRLDDASWEGPLDSLDVHRRGGRGSKPIFLTSRTPVQTVWYRHDDKNLYVAYKRRKVFDRKGKAPNWTWTTRGKDANVWEDLCFEILIGGIDAGDKMIHLGFSASGATYDALRTTPSRRRGKVIAEPADPSWNGQWRSAHSVDDETFVVEAAIPWKTLEDLGLDRTNIGIKVDQKIGMQYYKRPTGVSKRFLRLSDKPRKPAPYTVRLHFAELVHDQPSERVFDVKLQGKTVLRSFDVFEAAGGKNKALIKEFKGIMALDSLDLEFVAKSTQPKDAESPIISGLQIVAENPGPLPLAISGQMIRATHKDPKLMSKEEINELTEEQRQKRGLTDPKELPTGGKKKK